uniref:Uncharacterized protein n=1 Tax=Arundo donax TaxID=35708 RepID=A0A0A9GYF1_ARUDO
MALSAAHRSATATAKGEAVTMVLGSGGSSRRENPACRLGREALTC